jgi:hypothetical protein
MRNRSCKAGRAMNRIVEKIRAMLRRKETVPPDDIEELCDEAEALQGILDRITRTGDYAPKPEQD